MARDEHDREDLLREATALVERVALHVEGETELVVVGFRSDGCCSVYFGADPAYQFNRRGELRRAFRSGKLLKADRGTLAELTRERTATETQLTRVDLDGAQTDEILAEVRSRLAQLRDALDSQCVTVAGQVPRERDVVSRARIALTELCECRRVASSPQVG